MPALVNVKEKVAPGAIGVESPELNVVPSSLVTVWGVCVEFFQMTVVPTLMVSEAGLKVKVPVLSKVIVAFCVGPVTAFVAVGVTAPPPP